MANKSSKASSGGPEQEPAASDMQGAFQEARSFESKISMALPWGFGGLELRMCGWIKLQGLSLRLSPPPLHALNSNSVLNVEINTPKLTWVNFKLCPLVEVVRNGFV